MVHKPGRSAIRQFAALTESIRPHQLNEAHIRATIADWKATRSRSSAYNYRHHLKNFIRHLTALGAPHKLLEFFPKLPAPRPRTTIATPPDLARLLHAAAPWLRCAITIAAHAGLRASDATRLAPANYNPDTKTLTIRQAKTNTVVTLPVTETLASELDNAPHTDDPTTPYLALYRGRPTSYKILNRHWCRLKRTTGADPNLTFHDLRRTLAVALYEVSKDLRVVEQMLGHQSLSSTVKYLEHRDPQKLKPYLAAIYKPQTERVQ